MPKNNQEPLTNHWSLLTKSAAVDQTTNNIILGEVLEQINFQIPKSDKTAFEKAIKKDGGVNLPLNGYLVSYFESNQPNSPRNIEIEYELPNNEKVLLFDQALNIGPNSRGRHIGNIQTIKIIGSGKYIFRVKTNENKKDGILAEVPLYITISFV